MSCDCLFPNHNFVPLLQNNNNHSDSDEAAVLKFSSSSSVVVHASLLMLAHLPLATASMRMTVRRLWHGPSLSLRRPGRGGSWRRCISNETTTTTLGAIKAAVLQPTDENDSEEIIDCNPYASKVPPVFIPTKKPRPPRLPALPSGFQEFPNTTATTTTTTLSRGFYFWQISPRARATRRIVYMAWQRVLEPPTLHLLAAAAGATLTVGSLEATLLCQAWPFVESADAGRFVLLYSMHNLFPSVVWQTHDAALVCTAWGLDPTTLLRDVTGVTQESAIVQLETQWLSTSRFFFAGFMMMAQLFRAASISMETVEAYEQSILAGREPPLHIPRDGGGLVTRLCGRDSHVSEVSLVRMGTHLFPVFEEAERVRFLVRKHSLHYRQPVFWCVPPYLYWRAFVWENFPVGEECFVKDKDDGQILILEADATNGNDPLAIGNAALDLTLEDASQGFRRILQRYRDAGYVAGRDFRTLRVYLGNSMEVMHTGGGHAYTLRHRIRYAKEMDVLIDARAPVLRKILQWCASVAASTGDRKLFFQTSSREYFLNLQSLLKEYGYEIYDPLDLRRLHKLRERFREEEDSEGVDCTRTPPSKPFLSLLLEDANFVGDDVEEHGDFLAQQLSLFATYGLNDADTNTKDTTTDKDMLRKVARLAKLPRLIHMETTAQTVNAMEALIAAGEVDVSRCCALLDRQEGTAVLESTLRHHSGYVQSEKHLWERKAFTSETQEEEEIDLEKSPSGLQFICSSSIHDNILRQVRWWARLGYDAAEIQREIDTQYQEILHQSHTVQKLVAKSKPVDPSNNETPSVAEEEKEHEAKVVTQV